MIMKTSPLCLFPPACIRNTGGGGGDEVNVYSRKLTRNSPERENAVSVIFSIFFVAVTAQRAASRRERNVISLGMNTLTPLASLHGLTASGCDAFRLQTCRIDCALSYGEGVVVKITKKILIILDKIMTEVAAYSQEGHIMAMIKVNWENKVPLRTRYCSAAIK